MGSISRNYYPTEEDSERFWASQSTSAGANEPLPEGFPSVLKSPLAWTKSDVEKQRDTWTLDLTDEELKAIDLAVKAFQETHKNLSEISEETFKLPQSLHERLRGVSDQCYHGIGFQIVHGLNPENYTVEENAIVLAGIGAHIGSQRGFVDTLCKRVISHIVNVAGEKQTEEFKAAPGFTNAPLSFHTDECELMALYCRDTAVTGGESLLTSSWHIYNEIVARKPHLLKTLNESWVMDTFKDYDVSPPRKHPLLEPSDVDKVLLRFSRYPITGWKKSRNPDLPPPTEAQLEAIDAVHFIGAANATKLLMRKGDILFVNDMAIMHARESFQEDGQYMKRHLIKMFFSDPKQKWPIAPSAQSHWERMYGPNLADGTRRETWDLEYFHGQEDSTYTNG